MARSPFLSRVSADAPTDHFFIAGLNDRVLPSKFTLMQPYLWSVIFTFWSGIVAGGILVSRTLRHLPLALLSCSPYFRRPYCPASHNVFHHGQGLCSATFACLSFDHHAAILQFAFWNWRVLDPSHFRTDIDPQPSWWVTLYRTYSVKTARSYFSCLYCSMVFSLLIRNRMFYYAILIGPLSDICSLDPPIQLVSKPTWFLAETSEGIGDFSARRDVGHTGVPGGFQPALWRSGADRKPHQTFYSK